MELLGDILEALYDDLQVQGETRLTRVQAAVNMPYDRFKFLVDNLVQLRLLSIKKRHGHFQVRLEERASRFVCCYKEMKTILELAPINCRVERKRVLFRYPREDLHILAP